MYVYLTPLLAPTVSRQDTIFILFLPQGPHRVLVRGVGN